MADTTEKKTYLVNIESNLKKYIEDTVKSKQEVDKMKAAVEQLKAAKQTEGAEWEQANAKLRTSQKEYNTAKMLLDSYNKGLLSETNSRKQLSDVLKLQQYELGKLGDGYIKDANGMLKVNPLYIEQTKRVRETKEAIILLDKAQLDGRSSVGLYSEAIEGALGKFQMMPGPVGAAASSLHGVNAAFKTLIANPVTAAIAAVIAVFAGLIKIFKGTAEGGGKIKDLFAGIGAVINELRARVVSFINIFQHVLKGEWKEAGEAARETFTNLGTSLKEAAENAMELSKAQRQLTKELAMHVSEEANEVKRIQELLYLSKDKSKTDQARLDYLKEALRLGQEQADREVEYAKRQWDIDVAVAANKAKIDKDVLDKWVQMDADAQNEMLKNRKDIQAAYNLLGGAEALKTLEESYAKQLQAQTDFFAHNKRAISQSSALEEELKKEKETKYKEHLDRLKKASDDNVKLMILEAGNDADKKKAALKYQYDQELALAKLSNTEKLILKKEYENAVNEIEQERIEKSQAALQKEVDDYKKQQEDLKKQDQEMAEWKAQDDAAKFEYQRMQNEGNVNALQQILDDEWEALKKSKEYENAIAKIDEDTAAKKKAAQEKADKESEVAFQKEVKRLEELADIKRRDTEAGFEYQRMKAGENVGELQKILDLEYGEMLASVEYKSMTTNEKLLIDKQYTENTRQLTLLRMDQMTEELNLTADIMGSMAGLFGKQTIAAKALSIAQALISTYTAGVKAMAELPIGSGPVLRFLTLASIIAAGLLQVKNIIAVKVPGGGGGGGGEAGSLPTAIISSLPAQRAYAPAVGSTYLNQPQLTQAQINAVPNQNPLTAEQIATAMSKMPAPVVTVEDINARISAGKKIEVMATI
ncbi:MAG: hypothetical protein MUO85_03250 [candidate division Zixibacteria bacterium]|nr:hypothetical protein [candidate division Zixibacteria bacterium]